MLIWETGSNAEELRNIDPSTPGLRMAYVKESAQFYDYWKEFNIPIAWYFAVLFYASNNSLYF